eukprot:CAMPEP_0185578564 /NCGR_PEP_ID=MMETSP0434-20130131/13008_1 /TAXON_ID=626734 ORGANISM="Favella taraikaensis, Strain Fe Narragansett Bay" /NCGR_SAMPLE_ID=MMETSP0434 /ASSEMBLY_ACC=CAM_ASM_000379 /LENGTH=108 /DNA_ID=CAMNT_0028196393 /DNA_START=263 /DNA_END=588 /DNA_ORIENTATION=+
MKYRVTVLFTQALDGPDEDDAVASDKFLVQLTRAPAHFEQGANMDGREIMQQLIAAWSDIDRKDKYEFKLRVAKRKDDDIATPAPTSSAARSEPVAATVSESSVSIDP